LKTAVFDIETSALEGIGAGMLLCACVRPVSTNRTRVFRCDQYPYEPDPAFGFFERQEKDLLTSLVDELSKYDLLIGHNLENFDLGFIRTRAYRCGVPFPLRPFTYDTMKAFRRVKMRTVLNIVGKPSASMDMVADFLGIDQEKTKLYPVQHWQTVWGNETQRAAAMNDLVDHCQRDVRMNARIYELLLPYDEKANIRRWQ
jgi:DNA polymerase III epsilon subunit-like protein